MMNSSLEAPNVPNVPPDLEEIDNEVSFESQSEFSNSDTSSTSSRNIKSSPSEVSYDSSNPTLESEEDLDIFFSLEKPDNPFDQKDEIGTIAPHESFGFSVQGLYTKRYLTEEEKNTSLETNKIICRQRIKTRPIDNSFSDSSSKSSSGSLTSPESPNEEEEYESAMFVPETGLVNGWFWHQYDSKKKIVREDRAILFQSQENYKRLIENHQFKSCFDDMDYMETAPFGEQVIVNGCDASELAIGDVFEVEGGHSPLIIEITAPRKPCIHVNKKIGTPNGLAGIQAYALSNFLSGWFARVIVSGELSDGMRLTRKAHPNPKWTLTYITKALYGEGSRLQSMACIASWNRDRSELEELISLPQLGEYEWKNAGRRIALKLDGINPLTVRPDLIDPQIDPTKVIVHQISPQIVNKASVQTSKKHNISQIFCIAGVLQLIALFVSGLLENKDVRITV
jgi:MOSC domain-containing protein YiiM